MIARLPVASPLFGAAAAVLLLGIGAPAAQAQDNRLVTVKYDPDKVVQIRGRAKVQATIRFADDERIENVAIGDSNAWQVTPNKRANLLFIKPLAANAATNMTVVTNARTYFFDLLASNSGKPVYVLNFEYPTSAAPADGAPVIAQNEGEVLDFPTSVQPDTAAVDPAALNFEWKLKGDRKLLPERAYDDGTATFLVWPEGKPVPAILMVAEDGKTEGPVNFTVRGDTVMVEGVPQTLVLRAGKNSATLTYQGKPLEQRQAKAKANRASTDNGALARNMETK